jgi:hypothetical protein
VLGGGALFLFGGGGRVGKLQFVLILIIRIKAQGEKRNRDKILYSN